MPRDAKARLILGDMLREQCCRYIDIDQHTAVGAANVVVPVCTLVKAAGFIPKRKLKDNPALGEQVQRPVDGPVGDRRVTLVNTLEDFAGGEVTVSGPNCLQNRRSLRRHAEATVSPVHHLHAAGSLGHRLRITSS